ncbi:MAG: PKD domain-containing protein [Saprospiraceae bacterium]
MKKLLFKTSFLFLLCLLTQVTMANDFTVNGKVSFGEDEIAAPGFPITIYSVDGLYAMDAVTDDEGNYSSTIDLPDGTVTDFTVEVLDFCSGEMITQIISSSVGLVEINFLICDEIIINTNPCQAFFSYAPGAIDPIGFPVDFVDNSSGDINTWAWDFGDGNTSDEQNPSHIYDTEGTYTVSLTIAGDSCDNVYEQLIIVGEDNGNPCNCDFDFIPVCVLDANSGTQLLFPSACFAICEGFTEADFVDCDFGGGNNNGCHTIFSFTQDATDPLIVNFVDNSTPPATSWTWDFGDGNTSNLQNPTHTYTDFGIYHVSLTTETDSCTSSAVELICIYENGNGGGGGLDSCACDFVFDPVCVTDSTGILITFPNLCFAECAGFTAADLGDCGLGGGGDPCNCPFDFTPVCVEDSTGELLTFPNACFAECEGYTAADFVDCNNGGGDPCNCGFDFDPVCVTDSTGELLTFPNACFAACEGYTEVDFTDCNNGNGDPCFDCIFNTEAPVCVLDSTGVTISFPNPCFAECAGYTAADFVDCNNGGGDPCNCGFDFDPVCVTNSTGELLTFPNACFAECEGYTAADFTDCNNGNGDPCFDCIFNTEAPVCVLDSTGVTISFPNPCFAECAGYTAADFVDCNIGGGDPCNCPFDFTPVCVVNDAGETLTFPNACFAECEGYTAVDFVDCGFGGNPCDCPEVFNPVCVTDGFGNTLSFDNECFAICEGYTPNDFVDCTNNGDPCNCDFVFDPVCVIDSLSGEEITLPSACIANCLGYDEADFVDCTDAPWTDCNCTFDIDPVCVEDEDGNIYTFLNTCFAECEGYAVADFVDCEMEQDSTMNDCGCDITFDPVCTTDDNGELLVFLNSCWATCAGVEVDELTDCDLDGNNLTGGAIFALMASPLNTQEEFNTFNSATAYPNPVTDQLNIDLTTNESLTITISLISITGQEVYTERLVSDKGENTFRIGVEGLSEGLYFARIMANDQVLSLKFVK